MAKYTMKRSHVNLLIRLAEWIFAQNRILLEPEVIQLTPEDWGKIVSGDKRREYLRIAKRGLGWDATSFGSGDFFNTGLLLFTQENGDIENKNEGVTYSQKKMIVGLSQRTPNHYHWDKTESIKNLGVSALYMNVWLAHRDDYMRPRKEARKEQGIFADKPFNVILNHKPKQCNPGDTVVLEPGDRITLYGVPKSKANQGPIYHEFCGMPEGGIVIVGETSTVNDDHKDNRFYNPIPRFDEIYPDEAAYRLLCSDVRSLFFGSKKKREDVQELIKMGHVTGEYLDEILGKANVLNKKGVVHDCYTLLEQYLAA